MTAGPRSDVHYALYLPRVLLAWKAGGAEGDVLTLDGTLLFADISGFTSLSEELARQGKIGSEEVTAVLNGAFSELLDVASLDGGDLLKFGGDALLLLFTGSDHAGRAARSAFDMRDALDDFQSASSPVPLAMSMGLASGSIACVLAGSASREMIVAGETAWAVVDMEATADAGEILVAPTTASLIDDDALGSPKGSGVFLEDAPDADEFEPDDEASGTMDYAHYVPQRLRKHLTLTFNEGEHRIANVAFVKVSGLDELLESTNRDAAQQEMDRLVSKVQEVAARFEVTVLASDISPDGFKLILVTGVPDRQDGEEERILRAGHEVADISSPLQVSVGIARGNVFAGDLGSRMRRVYTVIGDTVNLAARLAAAAQPGTALVTGDVLERSASLFDATALDPIHLKGKAEPVAPYRLNAQIASGGAQPAGRFDIIGRDDELDRLMREINEAKGGAGEVVDIDGVAGIGKTRLLQEVAERSEQRLLVATGEAYESSTAFYVAGQIVLGAFGLSHDKAPEELGQELEEAVAATCHDMTPWLPLVARVVGAEVPSTPEVETVDGKFQAQKTAEVIEEMLTKVLDEPTLIVIDGAEWIDEASREILMRMMAEIDERPWVVCTSRRPGQDWDGLDPGTSIALPPLSPDSTRRLLGLAAADLDLPISTFNAVAERSGGNPFFLLELVAAVRDGGDDLPESIEAVAAERIDRLELRDRRLLRYAAVLGQTFAVDLLADALPDVAAVLEDTQVWDRLAEFLEISATGRVRFRQPILRDAAYAGLPYGRRRELHLAIGEALERRARRRPERFSEMLSLHFSRAEDYPRAWEYSVMAAQRAQKKYANVVAADLYRRALAASDQMEAVVPEEERAEVAEAMGDAADAAGLHDEAWGAYEQALTLAHDNLLWRGRLLRKESMVQEKMGAYDDALEILQASLDTLEQAPATPDRDVQRLEAMIGYAGVLRRKLDPEGSIEWCRRVLDSPSIEDHPDLLAHALNLLSTNYAVVNHDDRGAGSLRALEIYRELGDLVGEAKVLNNLGYNAYFLGEWTAAFDYWTEGAAAADKAGDVITEAIIRNNLAEIDIDRGRYEDARSALDEALRIWRGARYSLGLAFAHANLGRLEGRDGDTDKAAAHLERAAAVFEEVGAPLGRLDVRARSIEVALHKGEWQAAGEMLREDLRAVDDVPGSTVLQAAQHRLLGYAYLQAGEDAAAEVELLRSLELAREAKARFEEALTLHAMARWAERTGEGGDWSEAAAAILHELGVERVPYVPIAAPRNDLAS